MFLEFASDWKNELAEEIARPYFKTLEKTLSTLGEQTTFYPPTDQIFNAFAFCPFAKLQVVILGQDPYHGVGQAHGLAFSVPDGIKIPPSLKNIYKELKADLNIEIRESGNLEHWARQGVLLLNTALTVLPDKPGSHTGLGWETFSDAVIKQISTKKSHVVFILWGKFAQTKEVLIDQRKHLIIKSPHPSPLSAYAGFFGSKPFSKTNQYLIDNGFTPIIW